jgi:peptidoglycan/LPS O-acetylase OafA/YrhL
MNHHIQVLTGLRGLAALIVFISHAANQGLFPKLFGNGFGQIGVMIFFVLSGFLMAHLYLHKDFNEYNIKGFIFSRIARVFPLFLILVASSYIITQNFYPDFHYRIDSLSIFVKAIFFIVAPNEFWTIPVEVQFYIFFIIIWYVISKSNNNLNILYLWLISLLPSLIFWLQSGAIIPLFSTYSSAFIIGIIFSRIFRVSKESTVLQRISDNSGIIFLILIFVNLPSLRLDYDLVLSKYFFLRTWLDPINWFLVMGLFFCSMMNSVTLSFLSNRVFLYLGKISYALYLTHYPVLLAVKSFTIPNYLKFSIALLIVIILSHISLYVLEIPANRSIRSLGNQKSKSSNEV